MTTPLAPTTPRDEAAQAPGTEAAPQGQPESLWDATVAFLLGAGYRRYEQGDLHEPTTKKVLFQRVLPDVSPVCHCNDRLFVNITLFETGLPGRTMQTAEVNITAETPDEQWANLTLYSLRLEELLAQEARCVQRLLRAWQALNEDTSG